MHESLRPTWRNPKHARLWLSSLSTYAYPTLRSRPLDTIGTADILAVLSPIWTEKHDTAARVKQRMSTIFDWPRGRTLPVRKSCQRRQEGPSAGAAEAGAHGRPRGGTCPRSSPTFVARGCLGATPARSRPGSSRGRCCAAESPAAASATGSPPEADRRSRPPPAADGSSAVAHPSEVPEAGARSAPTPDPSRRLHSSRSGAHSRPGWPPSTPSDPPSSLARNHGESDRRRLLNLSQHILGQALRGRLRGSNGGSRSSSRRPRRERTRGRPRAAPRGSP